jgi:protease-4
LTGSIGIFGTVPNFKKIREKVGIDMDAVSTHKYSTMTTGMVYRGMSKDEHAIMQSMVERGYDLFTSRCADGRGMTQDAIKAVGEGRVWLGKDAVKLGLVDELGNINSAIQKAAELAELQAYQLSYYPEKKDPLQELLKMLDNSTPEERFIMNIREFASEARIMALMPEVTIQ